MVVIIVFLERLIWDYYCMVVIMGFLERLIWDYYYVPCTGIKYCCVFFTVYSAVVNMDLFQETTLAAGNVWLL